MSEKDWQPSEADRDNRLIKLRMTNNQDDWMSRALKLEARVKELVAALDKHHGTPCEQIRHNQEIERLQIIENAVRKFLQNFNLPWPDNRVETTALRELRRALEKKK